LKAKKSSRALYIDSVQSQCLYIQLISCMYVVDSHYIYIYSHRLRHIEGSTLMSGAEYDRWHKETTEMCDNGWTHPAKKIRKKAAASGVVHFSTFQILISSIHRVVKELNFHICRTTTSNSITYFVMILCVSHHLTINFKVLINFLQVDF
jgi:hypothetical protein